MRFARRDLDHTPPRVERQPVDRDHRQLEPLRQLAVGSLGGRQHGCLFVDRVHVGKLSLGLEIEHERLRCDVVQQ